MVAVCRLQRGVECNREYSVGGMYMYMQLLSVAISLFVISVKL